MSCFHLYSGVNFDKNCVSCFLYNLKWYSLDELSHLSWTANQNEEGTGSMTGHTLLAVEKVATSIKHVDI